MPPTFHYRKNEMKKAAAAAGHEVFASIDCRNQRGVAQRFTSFASHEEFAEAVFAARQRCFYEMIREQRPCKMYFDIEWVGSVADGLPELTLGVVQATIAAVFAREFPGREAGDCIALDGSRETKKGYKHSFHLIFPDMVFACNTGKLRALALAARAALAATHGVAAVDDAVYSRDRAFRAPLCHKLADESATPLRWVAPPPDERAAFLRSLASRVSEAEAARAIPEPAPAEGDARVRARPKPACEDGAAPAAKRARTGDAAGQDGSFPRRLVDVIRGELSTFLAEHGGCCYIGLLAPSSAPRALTFRYEHGVRGRREPCLSHGPHSGVLHSSDNQFVTLTPDSFVFVSCPHGNRCRRCRFNFGQLTRCERPLLEALQHAT